MQNPSQPSAIAEYNLATCSVSGSSQPVTRDQYPKIHWRPKYSYTHWIPFNTYSSSLQMQHLGGSCWVHFLKTGKTYFQTGFSPACSVCPEQIPREVASWHLLLDSKPKPCTHNVPCLGRTQYRKQVQDKLQSRILLLLLTITTMVARREKARSVLTTFLIFGSDYQHEERKTTFQSIYTEMLLPPSPH